LIAVVGMAGRFPGARNVSELWSNLRDGVESLSFLSDQQLAAAGVSTAEIANPGYVKAAAILEDVDLFDAGFFGFSPKDASIMDPQHRHFLECAWEALENAGWCPEEFDGRVGVYAGSGMNSYLIHNLLANPQLVAEAGIFVLKQTGNDKDVLATRVSYQLGLTGPSFAVQTACSTSLVAIHLACQSLLNRECDMALAGGVTIEIPHGRGYIYREGEILSRDGHCRAFDAGSSGTIFGSGAGVVVLRRLEDALNDGDFIHAIVRGTAINNDGARKVGYLAPSVAGQAEVIAEALAIADVEPDSISYVETHGTGTALGDPIEITALTQAFRERTGRTGFCAIGSLKTNIGHLDAAAGVAGFIKTVLALEHRQIPASINFSKPNPLIDFAQSPFFVNTKLRQWESDGHPRRAAVTSLGIGGTNAHAILEEAPTAPSGPSRQWQLLTLSAKSPHALEALSRSYSEYLTDQRVDLADVAYTCHLGRKAFSERRAIVCSEASDAAALRRADLSGVISGTASGPSPTLVFLFSGQGSQYAGMGRGLYESETEFRQQVDLCAEQLQVSLGLDLRTVLFPAPSDAAAAQRLLDETRLTQPALFVIEYALAKLWQSWGIEPNAMFGHSIGEFVAACVAGVFSLRSALEIVAERGRLMQTLPVGAMVAVALPEHEVRSLLTADLCLAGVNSQRQCVVSGPEDSINNLRAVLATRAVSCQPLRVSHAFHSSMMDSILQPFTDFLRRFEYSPPRVPYISSRSGNWITAEEATDPAYWAGQLRDTVRFQDGMTQLLKEERAVFLEAGPGATLLALAAEHNDSATGHEFVASMRSRRQTASDIEIILQALGKLWVGGKKVDWRGFHAHERRRRQPLPTYPFERKRYWIEPQPQPRIEQLARNPYHDDSTAAEGFFHPVWKRAELDSNLTRDGVGPWLIFQDSLGLGATVGELLRLRGEQCVEVLPGSSFRRIDATRFEIAAGAPADYERLLAELSADGGLPGTVLHLWSVMSEAPASEPLRDLAVTENLSFYSLLFLAQALGTLGAGANIAIGVVSNSLHQVAGEPIWRPERALALGPCGVIPKEFPNLRCRSIDVVLPVQAVAHNREMAAALKVIGVALISEMGLESSQTVIAYRANRRWVRSFESIRKQQPAALVDRGVYLITGGLGGIGLVLAKSLARCVAARLVLVGRSAFPAREEWDERLRRGDHNDPLVQKISAIQAIKEAGGEVLVLAADVTDAGSMRRALAAARDRFGRINGVIHAAGVLDDAPILKKDAASAARVLAPKVRGTLVLEAVLAEDPPELFIVMSSISALLKPAGQVDYAGANSFLDTFACERSSRRGSTISIQWPRWRDTGMAADFSPNQSSPPPQHPLLQKMVERGESERVYSSELSLEEDWVVGEHRLPSGAGLFPGTGYIEMVLAALAPEARGRTLSIRNLRFEGPLRVEAGSLQNVELTVRRRRKEYTFTVSSGTAVKSDDTIECARGEAAFARTASVGRENVERIRQRCKGREIVFEDGRQNQKQERYISFGPRWRCLKRVSVGNREALSVVQLPGEFAADLASYRLHPAILDMATGSAMFLIPGYDQIDYLYIPVAYGSLSIRGVLPARCYAHIRAKGEIDSHSSIASFDISVLDEDGRVVLEIADFSLQQIRNPAVLDQDKRAGHNSVQPLSSDAGRGKDGIERDAAITSRQGVAAFGRILSGCFAPNVAVFHSDLIALLERTETARGPVNSGSPAAATTDSPRDEVEATLSKWWKELLGLGEIGRKDHFFELGGQSLTAIRLLARIKKVYGVDLSSAAMLEAATIERLARLIRKDDLQPSHTTVLPMQIQGSGPPLFLIHALGGRVIGYNDLVKYLRREQPVYGVEFELADSRPKRMRMEYLAENYIKKIRAVQPAGPYHLLGYSFGGLMAFEIAQQLRVAGESVEFLGMMDTWQTGHLRSLNGQQKVRQRVAKQVELRILHARTMLASRDPGVLRNKLEVRVWRMLNDLTGLVLRSAYSVCGALSLAVPKCLQRAEDINWFAIARYSVRPYPGTITLFRADQGIGAVDDRYGEELGWGGLAQQGIEVHRIPGSHLDLMREPNVRFLAQQVSVCLARCRVDRTGIRPAPGDGLDNRVVSLEPAPEAPSLRSA
jgi:acyl transferase domain-containing protein/thioesterase domain-containing protein